MGSVNATLYRLRAWASDVSGEPCAQQCRAQVLAILQDAREYPDEVERLQGELVDLNRRIVEFLASIQSRIDACTATEPAE